MPTIKIYKTSWRENAKAVGSTESVTDAIIMIDHLLNGKSLVDNGNRPAYYDYHKRGAFSYIAYRQRDIIDFKIGKIEILVPIYSTPYYITT